MTAPTNRSHLNNFFIKSVKQKNTNIKKENAMQIKTLVAMKRAENNIKVKDILGTLKITNATFNNKINKELINLKELKQLKELLCISNAELVGIF